MFNHQTMKPIAAIVLSLATLTGCEKKGDTTAEGPDPTPNVAGLSPEMKAAQLDLATEARKVIPKMFETYVRQENSSDKDLIAAHARAKEFADSGKFFADQTYLPGEIRTWNQVLPIEAEKIFEKMLVERGIKIADGSDGR